MQRRRSLKLDSYVDQLAAKINLSQTRQILCVGIFMSQSLSHGGPPPSSYAQGITQLKNYLDARYKYLEEIFSTW
jgi:hypothetical protein